MGRHSRNVQRRGLPALGAMAVTTALGLGTVLAGPSAQAAPVLIADSAGDGNVPGTPCTVTARACADLSTGQAWLISRGAVTRGPLPIKPGTPEEPTPVGTFQVQWKDRNHVSAEFDNAPMPFSVFFASGGIAFHEGSLERFSAGCVHLTHDDAVAFFDTLQVGDEVQVH